MDQLDPDAIRSAKDTPKPVKKGDDNVGTQAGEAQGVQTAKGGSVSDPQPFTNLPNRSIATDLSLS